MAAQLTAKRFNAFSMELEGISRRTMEEHYKLYQGYVNKYNEIRTKLAALELDPAKANQTYSDLRELKVELTFAYGGVLNHEIYFNLLGGKGGQPSGKLATAIQRDFGSFENWAKDLKATGLAARGWVWLAWDWNNDTLFNFLGDAQNTYPVWGCSPILALDTYEHAYFIDFGSARAPYIDAFLRNLDWAVVEKQFESINPSM